MGDTPDSAAVPAVPDGITACLFDLDGVLTQTAKVHAAAWKEMFDDVPARARGQTGRAVPSLRDRGRLRSSYVDGKLRQDGVRAFLASRGIDAAGGLGRRSAGRGDRARPGNAEERARARADREREGVEVYEGSVRFVEAVRDAGLRRAVVSASKNCREVLAAAGIERPVRGAHRRRRRRASAGCAGKPAPDTFLAAAEALGRRARAGAPSSRTPSPASRRAGPARSAGSSASTASGSADALRGHGADIVVSDLSELLEQR